MPERLTIRKADRAGARQKGRTDVENDAVFSSTTRERIPINIHDNEDCWSEALEALRTARAASWKNSAETQSLWDAVTRLESGLFRDAETLANLANKLTYLLNVSAPHNRDAGSSADGSWRHALLTSIVADAMKFSACTLWVSKQQYQRLVESYRNMQSELKNRIAKDKIRAANEETKLLRQELEIVRAERDALERALDLRDITQHRGR